MNLPNKITITRMILIPLFMVFLLIRVPHGAYIASGIFIIAALTDSLDGYLARKHGMITKLGKFMDPLADKLLISAALVTLTQMGRVSAWTTMIIIGREFAITGFRAIAASEGVVIAANRMGKAKTLSQIVAIIFVLLELPLARELLALAVILTVLSGLVYLNGSWNLLSKIEND